LPVTLASLAAAPRWVAWQTEGRGPQGKPTKLPYAPDGRKARADAPATWGTRAAAEARAAQLHRPCGDGGVGLELGVLADLAIGGLDLDTCRDKATGEMAPWARDVVDLLGSYAEVSPSGTGAKVFFLYEAADLPALRAMMGTEWGKQFKRRTGDDHPPAIELYLGNRYFAVTDDLLPDGVTTLRAVPTATLERLLQHVGPAFAIGAPGQRDAREKPGPPGKPAALAGSPKAGDGSRSAAAFKVAAKVKREGGTYERFLDALKEEPATADWKAEKGDANGGRELRRAWDAAGKAVERDLGEAETAGADSEKSKWTPPPTHDRNGRPVVVVVAGELDRMTTEAEAAIVASGVPIYQRAHQLVRPMTKEVPASHGRTTISAALGPLASPAIRDVLCGVATFSRFDQRTKDFRDVDPPCDVALILLSREGHWQLPRIAGVITTPTLRPDGSLLVEPGYDAATRLFHAADPTLALNPTAARAKPTRDDAECALALLDKLLGEFPFVPGGGEGEPAAGTSRSVALSGLITPVVRGAMSVAPMHAFRASTAGTGKSYLVDVASAVATGRLCPVTSVAPKEEETEKRLTGLLLAGFPVVSLDNVNGELGGDLLAQATERPLIRVRPLGASIIVEIENRACLFATGNNLRVRGDMTRRVLVCDLDAQLERPELREFKGDPVAAVLQRRGAYVSAVLTIVRAYLAAGTPSILPPVQSYGDWSRLVRSALVWLGCADPAGSMEAAREDDPELGELRELIGVWHAAFGQDAMLLRDVADATTWREETKMGEPTDLKHPDLAAVLERVAGERGTINTRRLSAWMRQRKGRIVDGRRFVHAGKGQGAVDRWAVHVVKG
jgi:hypothetical protein